MSLERKSLSRSVNIVGFTIPNCSLIWNQESKIPLDVDFRFIGGGGGRGPHLLQRFIKILFSKEGDNFH